MVYFSQKFLSLDRPEPCFATLSFGFLLPPLSTTQPPSGLGRLSAGPDQPHLTPGPLGALVLWFQALWTLCFTTYLYHGMVLGLVLSPSIFFGRGALQYHTYNPFIISNKRRNPRILSKPAETSDHYDVN